MIIQKISILFLIGLIGLFQPTQNVQEDQKQQNSNPKLSAVNIDSLKIEIQNNGWNNNRLNKYYFYLTNSLIDYNAEQQRLKETKNGIEKTFLNSIVLKRKKDFTSMYDSLFSILEHQPKFIYYYDELNFAAGATNQRAALKSIVEKSDELNNLNKNYLLGLLNAKQGQYEKAGSFFKKALNEDPDNYHILHELSYNHRNLGDYEKAKDVLEEAFEKSNNDNAFKIKYHYALGSLQFLSQQYEASKEEYSKALSLSIETGNKVYEAKTLSNIGIIYDVYGEVNKARDTFNKAIVLAEKLDDFDTEAHGYSELGVSYSFTNELVEAKKNYEISYKLYKKLGNRLRLAILSGNLAKVYMNMFDNKSALKLYEEGLKFSGEQKRAQVMNLIGIADVYANLANYSRSLEYYRKAREISIDMKELSITSEIKTGLGTLHYNLNRYNSALNYYNEAKEIIDELKNPFQQAEIYHRLGIVYFKLDSVNQAENYLVKSISTAEEYGDFYYEAISSLDLAEAYLDNKQYDEIAEYLNRAKDIASTSGYDYFRAKAFLIEGELANEKNNFKKSESFFKQALKIANELNNFDLIIETNFLIAKLYEENNLNELAESFYTSSINNIEEVSRPLFEQKEVQISFLSGKIEVYDRFAEFYLNNNEYQNAFELIDRSRSKNLLQNLNNLKISSLLDEETLNKIYDYEWIIHSGIYSNAKVDSVKDEYLKLKTRLIDKDPALKKYLNQKSYVDLKTLKEKLDNENYFLSIYSTEEFTYLFLISKNDFKFYKTDAGKDDIINYLAEISPYYDRNFNTVNTYFNQDLFSFNSGASNKFYSEIFKQIFEDIPNDSKIIISPSTELLSFPFEFLITDFNEKESIYNYTEKNYLIKNYNISYIPSATTYLQQLNNELKNMKKVLVVGDPYINDELKGFAERRGLLNESAGLPRNIALLPLKYSGEEVEQIGNIITPDKVLMQNEATETNFKKNAELSKIIHLSTHSFLFKNQPIIFFSNFYDSENDGFLEAAEIVQMKLNSDLVVLSSCNSGLGTVDEAEGIIGMTKAFFEAGTKSIIVSLWDVNDKYTSKLMTIFYEKLNSGLNKSEALRAAKIEFIDKHSANPYYWAGFVISGDVSKLDMQSKTNIVPILIGITGVILLGVLIFLLSTKLKNNSPA